MVTELWSEFAQGFTYTIEEKVTELWSEFAQRFTCTIEEKIQRALEEAVNNLRTSCHRSMPHDAKPPVSRSLNLHFMGTLPDEFMTLDCITTEGASLMVELQDSSGLRVEAGPEASVKIKILVLNGDFEVEDRDDWTVKEFDSYLAQPRKDKGPLLKGKSEIVMKNGVAVVNDIAFTDNSKSMRNGRFRLGARVVKGLPEGVEIRDGVSKAFQVKERRAKSHRKHKTLFPEDNPECLKHIGKTLAQKLAAKNIRTVQHFLCLYHADEQALKDILHLPENKWKELVDDAKSCLPPQEVCKHSDVTSEVNIRPVVFNRKISNPYAALDDPQKELVNNRIRLNANHEEQKKLQESHTPVFMTPLLSTTTLHLIGQHQGIAPPRRFELGSTSSVPHPSRQYEGMEWGGQDICSIPPSLTHQELHEKPYQLQESHTPVQDEFRPPCSIPQPSTSQHPDATAADVATRSVAMRTVDRIIGTERGGQEICGIPPLQTCQGEGLPCANLPAHDAEIERMLSTTAGSYNQQALKTMLGTPESQVHVDQAQLPQSDQCYASTLLPESLSDLEKFINEIGRVNDTRNRQETLQNAYVPLEGLSLQNMNNESEFASSCSQAQDWNQLLDSSPARSFSKRPRFD